MRKLAIFVLALAALSFGCKVGDSRWCSESLSDTDIKFGGPEPTIRTMLKDPCEGTSVRTFALLTHTSGETLFFISCPETHVWINIYEDEIRLIDSRTDKTFGRIGGEKARRAFQFADSVGTEIIRLGNNYNWNP